MSVDTERFLPRRAFVEEAALDYPLGREISKRLQEANVSVRVLKRGRRPDIPCSNSSQAYLESKNSLVVRVRKAKTFESCKPSAHYQIPLVTSCPGLCEYCYLQTRLGPKPYVRVYANIEEILHEAGSLIDDRDPQVTVFEGAATSDPLAVEWLTGSLRSAIEFFGATEYGQFRFVTKFSDVGPIIGARHLGHTTIRFSVNADYVIRSFEHRTSGIEARLKALARVRDSGYSVGVMIGPIIVYEGWKEEYEALIRRLGEALSTSSSETTVPFELITHRFTARAKNNILAVFPNTRLPLDEEGRRLAFGQFGYTKYVYPQEVMKEIQEFFSERIPQYVRGGWVQYLV